MWVITGPFDGEVTGEVGFEKSKLLKPSTTYTLGRKDRDLTVNSKKVSQNHCDFIVGEHTVENAEDHTFRPTLEVLNRNSKNKVYPIKRGGEDIPVKQNAKVLMESGDSMSLVSDLNIRVEWRPICVFYPPSRGKSLVSSTISNGCASLGIKLSQKMHENVTHHLAAHYVANLTMAASLLNLTRFVKPEWLDEVLRLGALPRNDEGSKGTALEGTFVLPLESKYRPSFSPSLLPKQKTFDVWEPNEERVNFFKPFRFVCLHEKVTELDSDIREAIDRGGGSYETFDIHQGVSRFHRALTRSQAKEGKKTVVVGDTDALQTAVGNTEWADFVAEARSFSSDIFAPSTIVKSVIEVDVSLLEGIATNSPPRSSPLPNIVPNSIPEEPTMQPDPPSPPKKPLARRARRLPREPSPPEPESPPRKHLVLRTIGRSREPSVAPEPDSPPRRPLVLRATRQSREPSVAPEPDSPPRRPLKRRTLRSREPSVDIPDPPSPPRKLLTRRLDSGGKPIITGLEDPYSLNDNDSDTSVRNGLAPPSRPGYAGFEDDEKEDPEEAERYARLKGLKRRVGVAKPASSSTKRSTGIGETLPEEPPLKKFKALFEASNPTKDALASFANALEDANLDAEAIVNGHVHGHSHSQTQTQTQSRSERPARSMGVSSLAILREEEEETQAGTAGRELRGAKRPRLDSVDESEGMEVDGGSEGTSAGASAAKKRVVENVNAVRRSTSVAPAAGVLTTAVGATTNKPTTFNSRDEKNKTQEEKEKEKEKSKQPPAATSKPDTDDAFLKAIASTKRGKRTEDEFDREFNKLKIRKPGLDEGRRDPEEEWAVLKDFGDDSDVRGNFMMIIDLEPYKKPDEAAVEAARQRNANPAWDGRPNFKKFKQKIVAGAPRKKPVELFLSEDTDYGMGSSYWRTGNSQSGTQAFNTTQMDAQFDKDSQQSTSKRAERSETFDDSEDDDPEFPTARGSRKPPSKSEDAAPSTSRRAGTNKTKASAKNTALFLDSDDDIQEQSAQGSRPHARYTNLDDMDDMDETLQSSAQIKPKPKAPAGRRSTRAKPAPAPAIVDDDSDEAVFKGFGKGRKGGR